MSKIPRQKFRNYVAMPTLERLFKARFKRRATHDSSTTVP